MTTLINKIEMLIKREKTTPERKKEDTNKSSSEILSELFSAFNADPPKIDEVTFKKAKKSKKKHKKEKKKRSRSSSSCSDSDNSEYSHKRKKKKKSKTKKRRDGYTPERRSFTPELINFDPEKIVKKEFNHIKQDVKADVTKKIKHDPKPEVKQHIKPEVKQNIKPEVKQNIKPEVKQNIKPEVKQNIKPEVKQDIKPEVKQDIKPEVKQCIKPEVKQDIKPEVKQDIKPVVKQDVKPVVKQDIKPSVRLKEEMQPKKEPCVKAAVLSNQVRNIDASAIPMPESPKDIISEPNDLRLKLDKKQDNTIDNADNDNKAKSKIQIKNLKFSAVFEETVKKAEEEARKKAEKEEEGEITDSSSSSGKDEESNSHFPKSSDPGGILKKQADEETKVIEEEKEKILLAKIQKNSESTHKSSHKESSKSSKRSSSKTRRSRSGSNSKRKRHRSKSKSRRKSRSRHRSRSRRRSHSRQRHRSSSKSRHRSRLSPRHRGRRSRSPTGVKLADSEKKRLLEVARRNAINMLKNGAVPAGAAVLPPHTRNQVMAAIQSGGKSVDELTDFCKHLSKKEALGELSSVSSNDDNMSENEDTIAFHHPFLVKEKAPIVMNIRGGAPLPIKSSTLPIANKEELRLQFPVSSGSQHREKASEWVPVSPKKDNMQVAKLNSKPSAKASSPIETTSSEPLALPAPPTTQPAYMKSFTTGSQLSSVPALPTPGPQVYPPGVDSPKLDIVATIVSQKLSLIRKEQEDNEFTTTGFGWSAKDCTLGQFTGSTGAQILTPRELASGTQAWAKKDQLVRAAPVEGGMGMHLLQKMGWTPGQGLGKEGTGTLQPLLLEVKLDTRGLTSKEEVSSRHGKSLKPQRMGRRGPAPLVAGGKHPVSLLGEYCSKHKLGPPEYNLCFECGPDHKKNFLFKVSQNLNNQK